MSIIRSAPKRLSVALTSCRRESAKGWVYAAQWFLWRFYFRFVLPRCVPAPCCTADDLKRTLTVVVPAAEKDACVLPLALKAAREMIQHPVDRFLVVAPDSPKIRSIAAEEACQFVVEDEMLPRPASELKTRGWLIQQFIKFNAAFLLGRADYLVLDSDTVLLRPQAFFSASKTVLKFSDQYELLYKPSLELLLGSARRFPVSFVAHHMVFNKASVTKLLHKLERDFSRPWYEAILHEVDHRNLISFSEFELYGNFVISQPGFSNDFVLRHWRGLDSTQSELADFDWANRAQLSRRYDSVSFHWHTQ